MAAPAKIDPMHQFQIAPVGGGELTGSPFMFTNSALWMMVVLGVVLVFMWGGMRRQLVPGRWQSAVEMLTGFLDNITRQNIGPEGRRYLPWVFTAFVFILAANWVSALPLAIVGPHPFSVTAQFTVTGVLSVVSFAIVLAVGFWKHGLHFFSLFVPHGTPLPMIPVIFPIELVSFLVRPFSLGLRLFVAMTAGHVLLKVLAGFVINSSNAGVGYGLTIGSASFILMIGISALEVLVAVIQAYVFALLTSVYLNDAENLH